MLAMLVSAVCLSACYDKDADAVGPAAADVEITAAARKSAVAAPANTPPVSGPTVFPAAATPTTAVTLSAGEMRWSDPATWGGTLPPAGTEIVIPVGRTIVLDTQTSSLGPVRVEGTLRFAGASVALTAASINVTGALLIGSASQPFGGLATITLTGAPRTPNDGVSRGLVVNGGRLEIYSVSPLPVWSKLNESAEAGATSLTLRDAVNWRSGDNIVVAPTDWYKRAGETERLQLAEPAAGSRLRTTAPLAAFRWGRLQYVTNSGMSLTPDATFVPPATSFPTVLDERAAVADLTRNVVIQSIDDDAWRDTGFGAHVMIMGLRSTVVVDGVEFRRVGQAGTMARYPFHWHMLSYDVAGNYLGDPVGHVVRNSSIWNSSQRCLVIHATNGVRVENNVCYDIKGHAFFLEDAVERRNVLVGNIALKIRAPKPEQRLLKHEAEGEGEGGPSGFWLTNPDNTVSNNLAGDSAGNGFWLAFPRHALGLSSRVAMMPNHMPLKEFRDNTAHSSAAAGFLLRGVPDDNLGTIIMDMYIPTSDGGESVDTNMIRFNLHGSVAFKNMDGAYRNRVSHPDYTEWVTADNYGTQFVGSTLDTHGGGMLTRTLMVGTSLNNRSSYPQQYPFEELNAVASYHSSMAFQNNAFVNFPMVDGKPSGAFRTNDYYIRGVERLTARNTGNRLINSDAGYRSLPPNMDPNGRPTQHSTLAGALWDANGYWGPAGNYHVYDVPFLTSGATCVWAKPAGKNGKSCSGEYYGLRSYQTDFDPSPYNFFAPIDVTRVDENGATIGTWTVADGATSDMLGNMRHFAARSGGRYILRFPGKPLPRMFVTEITNAFRVTDSFLFAVSFDGAVNIRAQLKSGPGEADPAQPAFVRYFSAASSLAEVSASAGDRYWQDRANNLVWLRIVGGLSYPNLAGLDAASDEPLLRPMVLKITAQ
ncbi:MAG: G8 domain-containing protein [Steroidobacteraceae bacterium]